MLFQNFLIFSYSDYPRPWQVSFQKPATTMMEGIIDLHHDILTFLIIVLIFVSFMLGTILYKARVSFNVKTLRLPVMQYQHAHGITHNTTLEIIWTIIPTLILLLIATPSFALIYALDEIVEPELTIRVVGRQWYWTYEFPDTVQLLLPVTTKFTELLVSETLLSKGTTLSNQSHDAMQVYNDLVSEAAPVLASNVEGTVILKIPGFTFNSYLVSTEDLFPGSFRLLETDRRLVLPFGTNIRVLVTSYDVIHSWAVPAFGIKVDALPGRLNEYYLNINYLGLFYGQCSEICGVNHGFMPIKIEVTTEDQFRWWFLQTSVIENNPAKFRNSFSFSSNISSFLTLFGQANSKPLNLLSTLTLTRK